ncbi:MAG: TlpA disulfide reductase family protein [Thermodesulfobacteriota bacterium]|nr:TlpA disulfide reductase family protein [Thermodesulfobacteriota bacterium]
MKKRSIMAVILLILVFGMPVYADNKDVQREMAPDFGLKDLTGITRYLSDYRGRVVLLDFTTTWCPHCKKDIPLFKEIQKTYDKKDLKVITVYIQESPKKVSSFMEKHKITYTMLLDTSGSVASTYGIRGVPTKILVDRAGRIQCFGCRDLDRQIAEML